MTTMVILKMRDGTLQLTFTLTQQILNCESAHIYDIKIYSNSKNRNNNINVALITAIVIVLTITLTRSETK